MTLFPNSLHISRMPFESSSLGFIFRINMTGQFFLSFNSCGGNPLSVFRKSWFSSWCDASRVSSKLRYVLCGPRNLSISISLISCTKLFHVIKIALLTIDDGLLLNASISGNTILTKVSTDEASSTKGRFIGVEILTSFI